MTTYGQVVGNISSMLRQVYKDRKIEPYAILYWGLITASKLLGQHLTSSANRYNWISGEFLTTFTVKVLFKDKRKYFKLPADILNYKSREGGIDYITYDMQDSEEIPDIGNNTFTRTRPSEVRRLYYNVHEIPSPANPYFYLEGRDVYLLGLESLNIDTLKTGLIVGIGLDDITSLDQRVNLPDRLISVLIYEVLNLGQFGLAIPESGHIEKLQEISKPLENDN